MTVVPLGIDLSRFQRRDASALRQQMGLHDTPVLMYVGFGTPRKGLDYLARAMSMLSTEARLVLIGRWERAYRAKFYRALGAARDRVMEIGYVADEDLPLYYSLADIMVFPSLLEGFGLPLVEAMACGTPIIASQVGSIPEIIGPGGRLVPPRNPAALAAAVDELLQDDALATLYGRSRTFVGYGAVWPGAHGTRDPGRLQPDAGLMAGSPSWRDISMRLTNRKYAEDSPIEPTPAGFQDDAQERPLCAP